MIAREVKVHPCANGQMLDEYASKLQESERRENNGKEEILPGRIDIPEDKEP